MSEITGGELLVRSLHAEGVRDVWAIPDGTYMIFLEALERLGPELGMRLFVPGHEAAAAHAADAMTRITGRPAVVMACAGPGAANLISGVLCAQDEGSPIVAITTHRRSDIDYQHMGAMQVLDQQRYFSPAVKWSARIDQWKRIPGAVRHAFRVAMTGRPGPVHIEFPEDLLSETGDPDQAPTWSPSTDDGAAFIANPELVDRAATMILDAALPLIHYGGGSQRSGAGEVARELAEYLGCPVTTGAGSRGIVPDGHPLVLQPVSPASAVAKNMADVVVAVGTRFGELDFWGRPPVWRESGLQKVVQIDSDPRNIGLNRPAEIGLVGDAKVVLHQLLSAIREKSPPRETYAQSAVVRDVDEKWRSQMEDRVADTDRRPMVPGQIFTEVNEFFPPNTVFALDGGNTCVWAAHYLKVRSQRSMLWTSNAGHLGTGLPFAIGAKVAAPERPVCCVSGDSAFRFNIQELETAVRHNLAITVIVAVDGAWGMEKSAQRRVWGREAPWFGSEHTPIRYDQVALAMGCRGDYAESATELRGALKRSAANGKPTVIHAVVDPVENIDPPGLALWAAARSGAQ